MAPVLSRYLKQRIINLSETGKTYVDICREIQIADHKKNSRQAVSSVIKRGSIFNKNKAGRPPLVTLEHKNYIDECLEKNDELSSVGKSFYKLF